MWAIPSAVTPLSAKAKSCTFSVDAGRIALKFRPLNTGQPGKRVGPGGAREYAPKTLYFRDNFSKKELLYSVDPMAIPVGFRRSG